MKLFEGFGYFEKKNPYNRPYIKGKKYIVSIVYWFIYVILN